MPKKLTDPRPRYYDSRTGRFLGDSEVYSKTFKQHRINLLKSYSSLMMRRVSPSSTATCIRHLPVCQEPRDQFVVSGLFEFTDIHKYNVWKLDNKGTPPTDVQWEDVCRFFVFHAPGEWPVDETMTLACRHYASRSYPVRMRLRHVIGAEPAELDEWLAHYEQMYKQRLVESFPTRVRQEWPDVQARAMAEAVEIASSLVACPMYGVTQFRLELYGCEIFDGLSGMCVPEYLAHHFARPKGPDPNAIARLICLSDPYIQRLDYSDAAPLLAARDRLAHCHANRAIPAATYAHMHQLLQKTGVRPVDMVGVVEHYKCSMYLVDINGSVFFSVKHEKNGGQSNWASVIGVMFNGHLYPVPRGELSLRRSLVHRLEACSRRIHQAPAVVAAVVEKKWAEGWRTRFLQTLTNKPEDPVLDPALDDLLTDGLAHKYICYTRGRLNVVYDFLVRNGRICQGSLIGGKKGSMTKWQFKKGNRICSQIQTATQLISADQYLECNQDLAKHYDVPFAHKNMGLWFNSLFDGGLKYFDVGGISPDARVNLLAELLPNQSNRCVVCRCALNGCHIDHRIPRSRGGGNDFANLQVLCPACNLEKSDRLLGQCLDGRLFFTSFCMDSLRSELSKSVDAELESWGVPGHRIVRTYNRLEGPYQGVDCNKQYSTCLFKMETRWPQFSLLDRSEPFDGTLGPGYCLPRGVGPVPCRGEWAGPTGPHHRGDPGVLLVRPRHLPVDRPGALPPRCKGGEERV